MDDRHLNQSLAASSPLRPARVAASQTTAMSSPLFPISQNTTDYPRDTTIAKLFEEVAVQYPKNIALTFGESQLTYRELNARADRLALYLRALGAGRQTLVA